MLKVYLASPYSNLDHEQAYRRALFATKVLIKHGINTFSPIVYAHRMKSLGTTSEFWEKFNEEWLSKCNLLVVYTLPGWEKSKGIDKEIKYAAIHNMEVTFMNEPITNITIEQIKSYEQKTI